MARTLEMYTALIECLTNRYGLFGRQGLESHLFRWGNRILKVYQWFILTNLGLEQERQLWEHQKRLLAIYAPALDTQVIAIAPTGAISGTLLNPFCYGLSLSLATPFFESVWQPAGHTERMEWAARIGVELAARHLQAPVQPARFYDNGAAFGHWTEEVLHRISAYEVSQELLPPASSLAILAAIDPLIQAEGISLHPTVPTVHGDPNLSNIVISADGDLQFIDPGPALLLGAGIKCPYDWTLDIGWDVALLAKHLLEQSGVRGQQAFLSAYSKRAGLPCEDLLSGMRYWQALCYLMIVAVCVKRWHDFQTEGNPFSTFLATRRISLSRYTRYFFAHSLELLGIAHLYPTFVEDFGTEIFTDNIVHNDELLVL